MKRCAVFWALVLSPFSIARAQQPGTIAGAVTSQQTGAPLAGASITIPGTKLGATTGLDGRYTMREVPAGTYRVQARLIGYGTAQDTGVVVTAGDTALAHFHLQAQAIQLDAVVAIGYATVQKRDVTGAVASVNGDDVLLKAAPTTERARWSASVGGFGAGLVSSSGRPRCPRQALAVLPG